MKDVNGNPVKVGDLLLEETGGGYSNGKLLRSFTLWEMPNRYNGQGLQYSLDKTSHEFCWADVNKSIKISVKELPKDFLFSFYHGMDDFDSYSKRNTVTDILGDSNWKEKSINPNDVSSFKKLSRLKLASIEDVRKNLNLFTKAKYIPNSVVASVIRLAGGKEAVMVNGELGFAMLEDTLTFQSIVYGMQDRN